MRITNTLFAQHIGTMFKRHWQIQGKRTPVKTAAFAALEEKGVPIVEAIDLVNPKPAPLPQYVETRFYDPEPQLDKNHPLYKQRVCHTFDDSNVLEEGVPQAQVLTKTLTVARLPEKLQKIVDATEISAESDLYMKNAILSAHLFEATQVKLPKLKDPLRPAWNFPRAYGISAQKKNRFITAKILLECEKLSGFPVVSQRRVIENARFVVPLEKDDVLYQFDLHAETIITSKQPLEFDINVQREVGDQQLPDLYPIKCNISIPNSNFYKLENVYPVYRKNPYAHLHTIFVHYTTEDVKTLYEAPVSPTQYESRNLVKAFTAAAARARALYGPDVKDLPSPVNVQSVQINGNEFHFGVYQLNTLDMDNTEGEKNLWFALNPVKLYDECKYLLSRPRLDGYNPEVLKLAYAFYKNQ